ncbi:MAG: hypothetical protein L6U99_00330 [Clostridium sp.]|nr:MAG: hypothetical protein L6U99_00330 [Clostridium sp.]
MKKNNYYNLHSSFNFYFITALLFFYYSFHITKDVLVPNVIDNSLDEGIKKIKSSKKLNYELIYVCGNGNKNI